MSQEKVEEKKFPETISFAELYKLVQKTILDLENLINKVNSVETELSDFKTKFIISSEFSEEQSSYISQQFGEIIKSLPEVLTNLSSKGIVAEIKIDPKTGLFSIQLARFEEQNEGNSN